MHPGGLYPVWTSPTRQFSPSTGLRCHLCHFFSSVSFASPISSHPWAALKPMASIPNAESAATLQPLNVWKKVTETQTWNAINSSCLPLHYFWAILLYHVVSSWELAFSIWGPLASKIICQFCVHVFFWVHHIIHYHIDKVTSQKLNIYSRHSPLASISHSTLWILS